MILIVCALMPEAKPLVQHFKLKKDFSVKEHELFRSEEIELIVSGVGKVKSAIAATALLQRHQGRKDLCAANIGICGSVKECAPGKLYFVNKITDQATAKSYFPDILLQHGLPEASLATFEKPVQKSELLEPTFDLVDMEAAGFMLAAQMYVYPQQILCAKVVSDCLEDVKLSAEFAQQLITGNCLALEKLLFGYNQFVCGTENAQASA